MAKVLTNLVVDLHGLARRHDQAVEPGVVRLDQRQQRNRLRAAAGALPGPHGADHHAARRLAQPALVRLAGRVRAPVEAARRVGLQAAVGGRRLVSGHERGGKRAGHRAGGWLGHSLQSEGHDGGA